MMSEERRVNKRLIIPGVIFLILSLGAGILCLSELVDALASGNSLGITLFILVLIIYGGIGLLSSLLSLLFNTLAYRKTKNKFTILMLILSFVSLLLLLTSFVIWIIAIKV